MKGKKNRKSIQDPSPRPRSRSRVTGKQFEIKFDVLKNDISCFINRNRTSKQVSRKNTINSLQPEKQPEPKKVQANQPKQSKEQVSQTAKRSNSPDLIKQSLNSILVKIEFEGIKFEWTEQQEHEILQAKSKEENVEDLQNSRIWSDFNSSFQKSYASTNDNYTVQNQCIYWEPVKQPSVSLLSNPFQIQIDYICMDWRTTIMIRNIPNKYNVNELAAQIDSEHADTYDFLYLPCDLKNLCNVGYGFINFVSTESLRSFYLKFEQYVWKKYRSEKICSLTYARLQGLNELIEHFSNSKVLNQKQKKYRPIIKYHQIHKMVLEQQKK